MISQEHRYYKDYAEDEFHSRIRLEKQPLWNRKAIYSVGNDKLLTIQLLIEGLMLTVGFALIASSLFFTGVALSLVSGCLLAKTIQRINKNDLKEVIDNILGHVKRKLQIYEYPDKNSCPPAIVRTVDEKGKTRGIIFNFYMLNDCGHSFTYITWFYSFCQRVKKIEIQKIPENEGLYREIIIKNYMTASEATLLSDLVRNRGVLHPNRDGVGFYMLNPMEW